MRIWVSYIEHLANHGFLGKPVEALPNWYAYQGSHKISALIVIIAMTAELVVTLSSHLLLFTRAIRGSESRVWFTICRVAKCYTLLQICYAILKVCIAIFITMRFNVTLCHFQQMVGIWQQNCYRLFSPKIDHCLSHYQNVHQENA